MTSKQRILNILDRKPVDRLPADIWLTAEVLDKLLKHYGVTDQRDLYPAMGVDKIYWLSAPYTSPVIPTKKTTDADEVFNEWGVGMKPKAYADGVYSEYSYYPLKEMTEPEELNDYPWPDVAKFDMNSLVQQLANVEDQASMLFFISLFEIYTSMRSFDESLMDLYVNKEFTHKAINTITEIQLGYIDRCLDAAPGIDLVYYSDDMGMQDRQIISTDTWNEFFREPVSRIIDLVHKRGKKVFHHTDGAAFDIVREIVELGADVINPIQYVCPGMERERLKADLGERVIFHGAVENQKILPFGTPEEVKQEVRENILLLGKNGGYIIAPCHNLQPNTPIENILAIYEAAQEQNS